MNSSEKDIVSRVDDWFVQSKAFLKDAKHLHRKKSYYFACFSCQQCAEFALKAACLHINLQCWGHELSTLLHSLESQGNITIPASIRTSRITLSKYYISSRYPDAYSTGVPATMFSKTDSSLALKFAQEVIDFVNTIIH